jgi:hypothetical protein
MSWHSLLAHFALVLVWLLPLMTLIVLWRFKAKWIVIAGLQVLITITGYGTMETGESLEKVAVARIGKPTVARHEERAEMFVANTVAASALAVATVMLPATMGAHVMKITFVLMLGQVVLFHQTWMSGRELMAIP